MGLGRLDLVVSDDKGMAGLVVPPQSHIRSLIPAPALHEFIFKNLDAPFSERRVKLQACMAVAVTYT